MHTKHLLLAVMTAASFSCGAALAQTTPAPDAAATPGKSPTPAEIVNAAPTGATGTSTGTSTSADTGAATPAASTETKAETKADAKATPKAKAKGKAKRKPAKTAEAAPQ